MFIGRCNIGREEGEKRMKVSEIYCVLSERYQTLADRAVVAGKNEDYKPLYHAAGFKEALELMYHYIMEDRQNEKEGE